MTYRFYHSCVDWPNDAFVTGGLSDLIDSRIDITRKSFLKHIDRNELWEIEESLGYVKHAKQGLTMAADWHVEYFRSTLHGCRVYGFRHSAIEFVFATNNESEMTSQNDCEHKHLTAIGTPVGEWTRVVCDDCKKEIPTEQDHSGPTKASINDLRRQIRHLTALLIERNEVIKEQRELLKNKA